MSKDGIQPEGTTFSDGAHAQVNSVYDQVKQIRLSRPMPGRAAAQTPVWELNMAINSGIYLMLAAIADELQEANTIAWTEYYRAHPNG